MWTGGRGGVGWGVGGSNGGVGWGGGHCFTLSANTTPLLHYLQIPLLFNISLCWGWPALEQHTPPPPPPPPHTHTHTHQKQLKKQTQSKRMSLLLPLGSKPSVCQWTWCQQYTYTQYINERIWKAHYTNTMYKYMVGHGRSHGQRKQHGESTTNNIRFF